MFERGTGTDVNTSRSLNDPQSTIKQQVYQIRLLTSDNQIKTQQLEILKEKVKELEDVNTIYQKQIANMEGKLKLYDQELKLKLQSSDDKSIKLSQNNQILYKKSQQLQYRVRELEEKMRGNEQELAMQVTEADLLRRKLAEMEDQLEKSKDKKKKRAYELERLSESNKHISAENQDLNHTVQKLTQENEKLMKVIEENEIQLKKVSGIQQQFQELRTIYENEFAESRALKQSYDLLKQKYDDVYYNYNVSLLNQRNEDSELETAKARNEELEHEIRQLDEIIGQKDKEISILNDNLRDLEHQVKDGDIKFETEIKKVINLIDGQTTSSEYENEDVSVAMRLLVENIIRQNKEIIRLSDRSRGSTQDVKELKNNLNKLTDERNVLKSDIEELAKENEALRMKLQSTVSESIQNINIAQASFEERLREMVNIQKQTEDRFNEQLHEKETEILYFQDLLNSTKETLRKVEADRDNTIEFLREQESEIKEFKAKFFQIAEETSHQKNRLNTTSYVLASLLKVFFNLLSKFDGLVHQKAFLSPYFYQYEKVKKKLNEMQLTRPNDNQRENVGIYKRFRKVVTTIMAAIRLRKLQLKRGGTKYDTFDVRHNLSNYSEGLKRFIIDLFRGSRFVIHKELVTAVEDILKSFENQSEDAIATKIIVAAGEFNEVPYEPEAVSRKRRIRDLQLDDITSNFRLKDDFENKLYSLDEKLRAAEEYISKQEEKLGNEVSDLTYKVRELRNENENYKREKDRMQTDYQMAKDQIDALLAFIDERQSMVPEQERRNRNLNEDYNILQDCVISLAKRFEQARKELEEKDLKMIELERQVIQSGHDENNVIHSTPVYNVPREKTPKVAGRIVSSGRKRNHNDI